MAEQEAISNRYAKALFEVATDKNCIDKVSSDLQNIYEVMTTAAQLLEFLVHPSTSVAKKKEILQALFKKIDVVTLHFLYVVLDNHRESMLEAIIHQFQQLVHAQKGEVEATVTSALPLEKGDKKKLLDTFKRLLGKEMVLKEVVVDSDLLGGVIVSVGDRIYDGSLRTKLSRFQERVKEAHVGS